MYTIGKKMHNFIKRLFPICRSITGKGVRETLNIIKEYVPELKIESIKSKTKCFDWEVPLEWDIEEAYIEDSNGNKIVDFKNHNLHIVNYSVAVDKKISFDELEKHLHYRKDLPEAIPYVTSYYKSYWGFCLSYNQYKNLNRNGKYKVYIKSKHFEGELNYGEVIIEGKTKKEIFFSTYICHPSLANDNLSGPALATFLINYVKSLKNRKYTYRFIFIPETIGSICYLSKNLKTLKENVIAGFVLTCVGDEGKFSYIPSRHGINLLNCEIQDYIKYTYSNRGSNERQYCRH